MLRQVRDQLAALYPTQADARRVADDAGLATEQIEFSDKASNNWHNILSEAQRSNRVRALLAVAHDEYPTNAVLQQAIRDLGQATIFLSYKRNVMPDEPLAQRLYQALRAAGHRVFLDQTMPVGVTWAQEIERQIAACDFFMVLLSAASIQSEMVLAEIRYATQHAQAPARRAYCPFGSILMNRCPIH